MGTSYSLVQRHKGRGIKTWYIRTCVNGKDSYKSTKTTNKTEAMKVFAAFVDGKKSIIDRKFEELEIREEFERFMAAKETQFGGKGTHSYDAYRKSVNRLYKCIDPRGLKLISRITPQEAQRIVDIQSKIYSPKTIQEDVKIYRMAINWILDSYDMNERNPFVRVQRPKIIQKMVEFWTPDEIDLIMQNAPDKYWMAFWGLMAFSGLRFFEAQAIRIEDITDETIKIRQGKMGKDAILPISRKLSAMLKDAKDDRKSGRLFEGHIVKNGKQCVDRLRKALRAAGLPDTGDHLQHKFRHSFASNLLRKGVNVKSVQTLGRWSSTAVLFQYYAGVIPNDLKSAVEML